MEFRQLRYFVAVAQYLNFSKAAQSVHITQSTISHQIRQLEESIGYPLFVRSSHQVKLTQEGEIILPRVVTILKDLDEAIKLPKVAHPQTEERVRILSGVHTMSKSLLPGVLKAFNGQCPHVSVDVEELLSSEMPPVFNEGGFDLAFGDEDPEATFEYEPLFSEELILVVAPGAPLARRKRIRMIELHGERLALPNRSFAYRQHIDRCFSAAGVKPRVVAEFNHPSNLLHAVAEEGMAGFVTHNYPAWLEKIGLVRVRLEDPTPLRNIVLYRSSPSLTASLQALSATICEQVRRTSRRPNDLGIRPYGSAAK